MDTKSSGAGSSGKTPVMGSSVYTGGNASGISGDVLNPRISVDEYAATQNFDETPRATKEGGRMRGSGMDKNSDTDRLSNPSNMQDKTEEDSFPASDPPSTSPMTGVGREHSRAATDAMDAIVDPSHLPADFKDNAAAQFEYGRRSQHATEHFDRSSRRLEHGNPDIGEVDLGTIEADKPAQPDDHDHYDSADDDLVKPESKDL